MPTTERRPLDRVAERQRAVRLARHYREADGLTIAHIAQRLGRAPATVKGYFYDPTRERARAVKARYVVCAAGAAPICSRATANATPIHCKACHPGAIRDALDTRERVLGAMRQEDRRLAGCPPLPLRQSKFDGGLRRRARFAGRPDRERGRRRRGWLLAHASESEVRLQFVTDQAESKHTGDSRNRGSGLSILVR